MKTKIPPADLVEEMLLNKGEVATKIYGSSMSPLLSEGKRVLMRHVDQGKIKLGDVVCFKSQSQLVAHRVVRIHRLKEGRRFLTKADNASTFDRYLSSDEVVGNVVAVEGQSLTAFPWKIFNRLIGEISLFEGEAKKKLMKNSFRQFSKWVRYSLKAFC